MSTTGYVDSNNNNNTSYQSFVNNGFKNYMTNNLNDNGMNKQQDVAHKQNLINNVLTHINLIKPSKFQQLLKKRQEEQKYLQEMENCFPFGRGGGGAPIRDKNGFVVAARRAFISNPKYNLMQLNVEDDYYDVWDKGAFKNKLTRQNSNNMNTISYDGSYNSNNVFINTAQRSLSQKVLGNYNNTNNPLSNSFNCINNSQQHYVNDNCNCNCNCNCNITPTMNEQLQCCNCGAIDMNTNQQSQNINYNNSINSNTNNIQPELTLSYDNYEINSYQKQLMKNSYKNDLLAQIQEKRNREQLERERKRQEDLAEEERLRREQEELDRKLQEEQNKNKNKAFQQSTPQITNIAPKKRKKLIQIENPPQIQPNISLNEELLKLREQMELQNSNLYNQINILRQETKEANLQRYQTLQEITRLQNEIKQNNENEEIRNKYVYDLINNENERYNETHLPNYIVDKVDVIPKRKKKDRYNKLTLSDGNVGVENGIKIESKLINTNNYDIVNECIHSSDEDDNDYMNINDDNDNNYCKLKDKTNCKDDTNEAHEIKKIYNKNVHRLHHLTEFENILTAHKEGKIHTIINNTLKPKSINKLLTENYDDVIDEINQMC